MSKFCLTCGDPLGTRQLIQDNATCDKCRREASEAKTESRSKSGLLQFVEDVENRNPLRGTGRLNVEGSGPE